MYMKYSILIHTGKGGRRVELERRVERGEGRESADHKADLKIPT
jgi:hypothetical protein